jgi:hypothetical protein
MNCEVMVDPAKVPGEHDVFVCGNDDAAKAQVRELLESFGWSVERIVDLGDITAARGTEMYLRLWLRLWGALQNRLLQHQGRPLTTPHPPYAGALPLQRANLHRRGRASLTDSKVVTSDNISWPHSWPKRRWDDWLNHAGQSRPRDKNTCK